MRQQVITSLRELASSLGAKAEGAQWYLFGSVDRDEPSAEDIDLMILCKSDDQADALRQVIDPDGLVLPLHLALLTFDEAAQIDAVGMQLGRIIFP